MIWTVGWVEKMDGGEGETVPSQPRLSVARSIVPHFEGRLWGRKNGTDEVAENGGMLWVFLDTAAERAHESEARTTRGALDV